jgi:putative peptide zinc metalloprotease protein
MAIDRPTFSEAWHQVAHLRPKLRSVVQCHRQDFRGQLWYVLRDPSNNQFFRVDPAGYHLIGLLDGRKTVADAWHATQDALGDRAPTQNETIQLLGQLHQSNLLQAELPMDAQQMFERRRKRQQREVSGYLMNLLFARIPLLDPDRFLDRWTPLLGWLFGPVGFALWLLIIGWGLFAAAGDAQQLWMRTQSVLAPDNLIYLYLCFAGVKALHEIGHGLACKYHGRAELVSGEVHTVGIMLLVLMPVPYVDASSAWGFRSKWRRAFVGLAGMYVELAVAAIAAVIWSRTAGGTLINGLAYNIIFIASVSTLLFNGNPLLRFDAYYVLSDLLEIPNLNQRSKEFLQYLGKRYLYGVRQPKNPAHSVVERFWLTVYGIASFVYRMIIAVGIFLFVAEQFMIVGVVLLAGAFAGWFLMPIGKFIRYLFTSGELSRTRPRAMAVTGGILGPAILAVGLIPVPDYGWAQGVVKARQAQAVHMGATGFIQTIEPTTARVKAQDGLLVRAQNQELGNQLQRLRAERRRLEARYREAKAQQLNTAQRIRRRIAAMDERISHLQQRLDRLSIQAPFDGTWVAPKADFQRGAYLKRGEPVGRLLSTGDLVVHVTADQYLGPRLRSVQDGVNAVQIRVDGRPRPTLTGRIERIMPAGQRALPSPALGQPAGGRFALQRPDENDAAQQGPQTSAPFFEVTLDPGDPIEQGPPGRALLPGQRVVVRFTLPSKPIWSQVYLAASQLLQSRLQL